jgi:hypothetical protein
VPIGQWCHPYAKTTAAAAGTVAITSDQPLTD